MNLFGDAMTSSLTNSSLSGTLEMKSASSLLLTAFGLSSFLVNLLVPQAIMRYLKILEVKGFDSLWKGCLT